MKENKMTEAEVQKYLRKKGWSNRVSEAGSRYLIQRWSHFAATVGNHGKTQNWLIDDYWILIEIRELIHDIGRDDEVKQDDEKFRSILTATNIKHRHKERNTNYDFWNYGYPKNATGFFYEQIKLHILESAARN